MLRLLSCALIALLSPTASAQGENLAEDMRLVRGLLSKLRFISYAQHVVSGMKKTYKDSADFKQVALLEIEVELQDASLLSDRYARRAAFKRALELLTEFVKRYEGEPVAEEAGVSLSEACIEFGGFLIEEIACRFGLSVCVCSPASPRPPRPFASA